MGEGKPPEGACQISGFPDYWATRDGEIWSRMSRGRPRRRPGGFLRQYDNGKRMTVYLVREGVPTTLNVGAAVLMAFVEPRPKGHQCCHGNGDYRDNRLENLRWGSPADNSLDALKHGTIPRGEQNHNAKLTAKVVREIRKRYSRASGPSLRQLAREFGVGAACVRSIVIGRTWRHVGES